MKQKIDKESGKIITKRMKKLLYPFTGINMPSVIASGVKQSLRIWTLKLLGRHKTAAMPSDKSMPEKMVSRP